MEDKETIELVKSMKNKIDSLEAEVKGLKEAQEKPKITKEQIIAEPDYHKRQKLIEENMDLFK